MSDSEKGIDIPSFFICPISLDIMKDPVTLSTGITYDREPIERWLYNNKNNTCPVTKQPLTDIELTPNHTLCRLIQSWCTINAPFGFQRFPTPRLPVSKPQILKLLQDLNSPNMQMNSLKKLKVIVLESDMNKRSVEAVGGADYLADVITNPSITNMTSSSQTKEFSGFEVVDQAVTILYHLRLTETGLKSLLRRSEDFVEALTRAMQCTDNYEAKTYALLLLKSLMEIIEPVQMMSLKPQFFIELTRVLVNQISVKTTKTVLKLLIQVCPWGRNKVKTVESGVVSVLIEILLDNTEKRIIEMVLILLHQLCLCAEGRAALLTHGAGLAVVSKKIFRVSAVASERAVNILHSIAKYTSNANVMVEMLQLGAVGKLCILLQVDYCGSKTSEKAREILKMHSRVWKDSSCIPYNLISSYPS